jgi:hypothetical protein
MPRVWNKRTENPPLGSVYVGRPSKWGNPYHVETFGRNAACDNFEEKVLPFLDVSELRGKDLVCWCAPLRCHADAILKKANS